MDKADRRYSTVCLECDVDLSKERIHLGYTTCVDCSDTEKYSSHTIYPHKTGGYIQPVSTEQADNMKRLDRRSTSGNRKAKGIYSDNSWDRWLKEYYKKDEPKKKFTPRHTPIPIYIPIKEVMQEVIDKYKNRGYEAACELTQSLYTNDKISLINKSKIINELTSLQMMSTKQRKFLRRNT